MTIAYMLTGKFVTYVPIAYEARVGRTHVKLVKDSMRTLLYICQTLMYYAPLKIFLLLAGLSFFGGLGCWGIGQILKLAGREMQIWYILGITGVILAGVIFLLGLLADVLKQILLK